MNEDEAALKDAAADLRDIVARTVGHRKIDRAGIDAILYVIKEHKTHCRQQGLDFPDMTIVVLPSVNKVRLHRRDLPRDNIERIVVNLKREFGDLLPMEELAWAVHAAWPDHKPAGPTLERRG